MFPLPTAAQNEAPNYFWGLKLAFFNGRLLNTFNTSAAGALFLPCGAQLLQGVLLGATVTGRHGYPDGCCVVLWLHRAHRPTLLSFGGTPSSPAHVWVAGKRCVALAFSLSLPTVAWGGKPPRQGIVGVVGRELACRVVVWCVGRHFESSPYLSVDCVFVVGCVLWDVAFFYHLKLVYWHMLSVYYYCLYSILQLLIAYHGLAWLLNRFH